MYTAVSEQLAQGFSALLIMHLFMKLRFKKKIITGDRGVTFSAADRSDVGPVFGAARTASKGSC